MVKILELALNFAGLYEVKSNTSWSDPEKSKELSRIMARVGHQPGWPYCASFAVGIWKECGQNVKGLSPSVMASYRAVKSRIVKTNPQPGAIFFMQHGNTDNGHAGLVVSYDEKTGILTTIEGNTSPSKAATVEQDRNGDGIFQKTRHVSFQQDSKKLFFLGFLNPTI